MVRYIGKRLLLMIPILLITSVIVFSLVKMSPGDPVLIILNGKQASQETKDNLRKEFNLDKPIVQQYFLWLKDAVRGDFGTSYKGRISVNEMISSRLGITAQMVLMSIIITLLIGIPLGLIGGIKKGGFFDIAGTLISYLGSASPVFFTGLIFVIIFSYQFDIFPAYGTGEGFVDNLTYLFLPSLALGLNQIALDSRILRSSMLESMGSNYITTVIAKGMPKRNIYFRHGLKNSIIPLLTIVGMQIGFIITGSVLVETVFGISGLGSLIVSAVKTNDYPLIQACTLLMVFIYIFMNTLVDVLYVMIDPRVSYERR